MALDEGIHAREVLGAVPSAIGDVWSRQEVLDAETETVLADS